MGRRMRGGATDDKIVESFTATLEAKLDAYEVILSKQKYLAGDVSSPRWWYDRNCAYPL